MSRLRDMAVTFSIGRDVFEVPADGTIQSVMETLDRMPDTFLFLVDGRPVPMDTPVEDGMTVKAVKVASGG